MGNDTLFVFGLLAAAIVLFASNRVRLDVTALLIIVAFSLSGVLTVSEAVSGFSDPTLLLIAVLFVIGEGLVRTGVAYTVGDWLMRASGDSETRLLILLMLAVAVLGAFMSSTGVVAIFIPVVLSIANKSGVAPGRLMMPLAHAALISGMLTLIATPPNLIANAELRRAGLDTFNFFSFTPVGLLVLAAAIGFMLTVGRRLLPAEQDLSPSTRGRSTLLELWLDYGLENKEFRLLVQPSSPLVSRTIADARLRSHHGAAVLGIERRRGLSSSLKPALADSELRSGDILIGQLEGNDSDLDHFCREQGLVRLEFPQVARASVTQTLGLAEVMLPPDSELIGHTLKQAAFRTRYGLNVLGIKRKRNLLPGPLIEQPLAFGDVMLVGGGWKQIRRLQTELKDFLVLTLPAELEEAAPARSRAPYALLCLLGMILLMTFGLVPNLVAALLAALAMGLFRCVDMESAYRSINWQSLVLIAGMLPFAQALDKTGGIDLIVEGLMLTLGDAGPYAMMAGLFALTAVIGMFVSNTATAVLMAPIAIAAAHELGVAPYAFVMAVAISASAAFLTPVSSPVNTLVLAPGNYRFTDFMKVGAPIVAITMVITLLVVPLLFPL